MGGVVMASLQDHLQASQGRAHDDLLEHQRHLEEEAQACACCLCCVCIGGGGVGECYSGVGGVVMASLQDRLQASQGRAHHDLLEQQRRLEEEAQACES